MDTKLARQDSMMISANCKKMGRLELIYTVNANMVYLLKDGAPDAVPESCTHFLQDKDKADRIYRLKKEDVPQKTAWLLKESVEHCSQVPDALKDSQAFKNLIRLIEEQTDDGHSPKDDKDQSGSNIQNPSKPDTTYRRKGNKSSVGYALNIVEARDNEKGLSMIVHTERQPNIVSESKISLNTLDGDLKGVETQVSDSDFYSREVMERAMEKGIEASFSALNGRTAP